MHNQWLNKSQISKLNVFVVCYRIGIFVEQWRKARLIAKIAVRKHFSLKTHTSQNKIEESISWKFLYRLSTFLEIFPSSIIKFLFPLCLTWLCFLSFSYLFAWLRSSFNTILSKMKIFSRSIQQQIDYQSFWFFFSSKYRSIDSIVQLNIAAYAFLYKFIKQCCLKSFPSCCW